MSTQVANVNGKRNCANIHLDKLFIAKFLENLNNFRTMMHLFSSTFSVRKWLCTHGHMEIICFKERKYAPPHTHTPCYFNLRYRDLNSKKKSAQSTKVKKNRNNMKEAVRDRKTRINRRNEEDD